MVFCIGSKIIEVDKFRVSSLPAKDGSGIFCYFWNKKFSREHEYVSKKYADLDEMYKEMRTGTVVIFKIEVGKLKDK